MQLPDNFDEVLETISRQFDLAQKPLGDEEIIAQEELKLECIRFTKIAKKYLPIFKDLYYELISKVVRKELSSGGELCPRGYYCPSPILDIIIGNTGGRGRLLKRTTSRSKPTFEYCFDNSDKMILINYLYSNCAEILEYKEDSAIGVSFSNSENKLTQIMECKYDENSRIVSLMIARSSFNDCNINEIEKEIYTYDENGLEVAEVFNYFNGILNYDKFRFMHDEEGYLTEYKSETSFCEDVVCKVTVKRRV